MSEDARQPPATGAEIDALRARVADQQAQIARLRGLDSLDALLSTLAGALDIREIFDHVADAAQHVLPHDGMLIGQVIDGGARVRMYATQGLGGGATALEVPNVSQHLMNQPWDF